MFAFKSTILTLAAVSVSAAAFVAPSQEKTRVGGAAIFNALILDGRTEVRLQSLKMPPATTVVGNAPQEIQFNTLEVFDPSLVAWVNELFSGQIRKRPGRTKYSNITLKRGSLRPITEALITEVGFPALNRSTDAPAAMSVKFRAVLGKPILLEVAGRTPRTDSQKTWLPSNFRLKMGGLPNARVQSMSGFVIKSELSGAVVSTIMLPLSDAKQWEAKLAPTPGSTAGVVPVDATAEYLGPDGKVRAVLSFRMLRMPRLNPLSPSAAASDPLVPVPMTIGNLRLSVG